MHYYKRNIGDYLKLASHLTLLEHGAYVRLKDVYFATETPIAPKERYETVCARTGAEKKAVDKILEKFYTRTSEGWANEKFDREIAAYKRRSQQNKENGMGGGRPSKITPIINPVG